MPFTRCHRQTGSPRHHIASPSLKRALLLALSSPTLSENLMPNPIRIYSKIITFWHFIHNEKRDPSERTRQVPFHFLSLTGCCCS
ncbi:hypothetical protein HMPREF0262_03595 [Clostridium sp. ATCC 29733]|nr:hypothetical protein HMPREF0262_03595 [Clostridium sp. ATCC 29733]